MKKLTKKRQAEVDEVMRKILKNRKFRKMIIDNVVTTFFEFELNWKHQMEKTKRKGGGK